MANFGDMSTHITEPRAREQQTLLTALHKMMGDGSDDVRNAVSLLMSKMDRPEPNSSNANSYPLSLVSLVRMVCPGAMIPPQRSTEPEQASSPLQGTMLRNNKKRVPITLECVKGTLTPVVPVGAEGGTSLRFSTTSIFYTGQHLMRSPRRTYVV